MVNIAICDDDEKDIMAIEKFVIEYMQKRDLLYRINVFKSGEELLASDREFNFVFLDIALGKGMNGIVAGKKFQSLNRKTRIIYITSFRQYCELAINNVHAFAYLEKPIRKENVHKQLEDVLKWIEEENKEKQFISFEVIEINKEHKVETVIKEFAIDEIVYFEYVNRKIRIVSSKGDFYFVGQMKKLINRMSEYTFESCHQCYLINLKYIKKIKGYELYLKNGEIIPVSQKKSFEFREKLNKFIQKNIWEK